MPRVTKKTRKKRNLKEQDDTESESGKLSETQEVVKKLSRTRLGKENSLKSHVNSIDTKPKSCTDPYDADSEVESDINTQMDSTDSRIRSPMSPMITESSNKDSISSVPHSLKHKSLKLLHHDQSTPSTVTPGRSDDSLFGFASTMESPLPFSPVAMGSPMQSECGSMLSMASSTGISPGKRKLQLRVFDVPVERPSKKIKKKKPNHNKQQYVVEEHFNKHVAKWHQLCFPRFREISIVISSSTNVHMRRVQSSQDLQDIMDNFEEVEMFSLAID